MASNQGGAPLAGSATPPTGKRAYMSAKLQSIAGKAHISLNEIPHSIRHAGAQYDPRQSPYTLKLQLLIKAHKGVVVDNEALGRETHSLSKQLFLWAQDQSVQSASTSPVEPTSSIGTAPEVGESEDLKDVGDRLAFLIYKSGDLSMDLAKQLEKSRIELKDMRNFENDLTKSRDRRKALEAQILKLQMDPKPRADQADRIAALSVELHTLTTETSTYEDALAVLKREKLRTAFGGHFAALREMGEKLALLSGYGEMLLEELEGPAKGIGYDGHERTAWIRGAAAERLATYQGPSIPRPELGGGAGTPTTLAPPHRSDTRSFGETHRSELARLDSHPPLDPATTPPATTLLAPPFASSELSAPGLTPSSSSINHSPATVHHSVPPPLPARRPSNATDAFSFSGTSLTPSASVSVVHGHGSPHQTPALSPTTLLMADDSASVPMPPPPPAGAEPTVAEIGGSVPTSTGGPASGILQPRRGSRAPSTAGQASSRPLTKAEEAASESSSSRAGGEEEVWTEAPEPGGSGLGRMASTSRRPDDDLPAYTEMESRPE